MEAARFERGAPSFMSGCISVFAKTPHLAAIGYITSYFFAASFKPSPSVLRRMAIWSIKAPVPPAQVPFILCSMALPKYVIFASSPPSSMATSVWGINFSTAREQVTTSCSNLAPIFSARASPPEPVITHFTSISPTVSIRSSSSSLTLSNTLDICLSYL